METYRFAAYAGERKKIGYIDGLWNPAHTFPRVNEIISRGSFVDPVTRQPIAVRVVEIYRLPKPHENQLVVVVTRADRLH